MFQRVHTSLDKLQAVLLGMAPGDQLSIDDAAQLTGLDEETCGVVLEALVAAGLMVPQANQTYLRCRLQTPTSR